MDAALGEPPAAVHPVVLMGRALDTLERQAPRSERWRLWYGLGVAIGLPAVWAGLGWLLERCAPWPIQALPIPLTRCGDTALRGTKAWGKQPRVWTTCSIGSLRASQPCC